MNGMLSVGMALFFGCAMGSCEPVQVDAPKRVFVSSFERVEDFSGFYITAQGHLGTSFHEQSEEVVRSGRFSHKAWFDGANPDSTPMVNNNHRGYPTVQLYKTAGGSFESPCLVTLWVWLDVELQGDPSGGEDDWFSFATFTDDESDRWSRTVLVNLSHDGFVHLQHTAGQGRQEYVYQTTTTKFPMRQWVELKMYLDFGDNGYAKVWQDGELVAHAAVGNISNRLAQAHFGLYSPPWMESGVVYNDDLRIEMVDGEESVGLDQD